MPESRDSLIIRVLDSVGNSLTRLIVCALLAGPGLFMFYEEVNDATPGEALHKSHLWIAVAMITAGAIALQPPFGKQLTQIVVTFFPNGLPLLGGRRATDPKPEEDTKP